MRFIHVFLKNKKKLIHIHARSCVFVHTDTQMREHRDLLGSKKEKEREREILLTFISFSYNKLCRPFYNINYSF